MLPFFFFSSRRRHTRFDCDWSSDVCSSDLSGDVMVVGAGGDDTEDGPDAGAAYVFVRSGNLWSEQQKLVAPDGARDEGFGGDRKSTRLNSSHSQISYAVFCLKKKKEQRQSS